MNFNQLFCTVLSVADRYQKLLEDEDKCKILKQKDFHYYDASLAQKRELETARQVLMGNYGFNVMDRDALQKSYDRLAAKLEKERQKYEKYFKELVIAIFSEFSDLPVEEVWPEQFIDSNNEPEPMKYYVSLVGFGKEEMFARRSYYRAKLNSSQTSMTPYELELAYRASKGTFELLLPIR